ncbi:MAG TPA: GNAT family N-acetyltransferase [Candidatus Acidoferrum sp.]|jgi:ribosomal protein S18 acetylase RimI-like enzyme
MHIRQLTESDADVFWTFRLRALELDAEAFTESAEEHKGTSIAFHAERLRSDPAESFVFGAFDGKELVGTAGFYREKHGKRRHLGKIWGVHVSPAVRGRGVGRQVLAALIEKAKTLPGLVAIQLSVGTTQTAARKLYAGLGFRPWGCEPRALQIGEKYVDEEHMVLDLDRGAPARKA